MSDASRTPETDEARDRCNNCGLNFVPADICEKLEAERDAALERERMLRGALQECISWIDDCDASSSGIYVTEAAEAALAAKGEK